MRVFFGGLAQGLTRGLARQAELAILTTIIISRDIRGFLDLEISLVLEVSFY